ncbi:MAG: hypothetical protein AB1333_04760, partial [Patescibacteria group bacterium]
MKNRKKLLIFFVFGFLISCTSVDELASPDVLKTDDGQEIEQEIYNIPEIIVNEEIRSDYCAIVDGQYAYCGSGFVCFDGICCPKGTKVKCGSTCYPIECECIDEEVGLCILKNSTPCGENIYCLEDEKCIQDGDEFLCIPKDKIYCGSGKWCEEWEICVENGCCPKEEPISCGDKCCFSNEICIPEENICLSTTAEYCGDSFYCEAGTKCAPDGLKICIPSYADYCGNGRFCLPGDVCTIDGCCPQGTPKKCGSLCCHKDWQCINNGEMCIPPNTTYCGGFYCQPDEVCILGEKCIPINSELCLDGHWCPPGLHCTGSTCCEYNYPATCGNLCCPNSWQCIENGKACIPPGGKYCKNTNTWCPPGEKCMTSGKCMPIGWQECGEGQACSPNFVCVNNKKCCPKSQMTLCGEQCCQTGYKCISNSLCIPLGAVYCQGKSEQIWCPAGTYCGKKYCIENGVDECFDGSLCPKNTFCTNVSGGPRCCPVYSKLCGNICCPIEYECQLSGGEYYCLPWGGTICSSGVVCGPGYECSPDGRICMIPGGDYCGNKKYCPPGTKCGGPCKEFCCKQGYWNDCMKSCMPDGTICFATSTSITDEKAYLHPQEGYYLLSDQELSDKVTNGVYNATLDADNWITHWKIGDEILVLEAAWIIDNAEGDDWPHGPYASIYLRVYTPEGLTYKEKSNRHLRGPHCCVCPWVLDLWIFGSYCVAPVPHDEWVDNEYMKYYKAGFHKWQPGETNIAIHVWESDPAGENDTMGLEWVSKQATKSSCGLWIPLHKDATTPSQKTWRISG